VSEHIAEIAFARRALRELLACPEQLDKQFAVTLFAFIATS
jgi:hypothetical protein